MSSTGDDLVVVGPQVRRLSHLQQVGTADAAAHPEPPGAQWRRYTPTEIATDIVKRDPEVWQVEETRQVLADLLADTRDSVPTGLVRPIATFFRVPVEYFTDQSTAEQVESELLEALLLEFGADPVAVCRTDPTRATHNGVLLAVVDLLRGQVSS